MSTDAVRAELDKHDAADQQVALERDTYAAQVSQLEAQLGDTKLQLKTATDQYAAMQQQLINANLQIAELEKQIPPPPYKLQVGGCPESGGTTLAAAQTVIDKYKAGVAIRQFLTTQAATRPKDAARMHISWKPTQAQITEAWITTITSALKPGDVVEVWHEADNKVSKGTLTKDDVVKRKNTFFNVVKKVRPDLLVANTLTGWLFDPKSGKNPDDWALIQADVLGVDCDGVRPATLPYTNYEDETKRMLQFLVDHPSYKHAAIPEFGCPRIPVEDPDGSKRASYHDHYFTLWSNTNGKVLYATMYEYNSSPNYSLETPAEIDGLKKWI